MIMKAKDFRALLTDLGSLTPVQRNGLMAGWQRNDPGMTSLR
jgi:hypothetical protein